MCSNWLSKMTKLSSLKLELKLSLKVDNSIGDTGCTDVGNGIGNLGLLSYLNLDL